MQKRIELNEKILRGKPIIKGTRISVELILDLLSSGMTVTDIIREYPHLKREDVLACLEYATQRLRREEVYLPG